MNKKETTETIPKRDEHIDTLSNTKALRVMLDNHINAFYAVENSLDSIEISISKITELLEKNPKSKIIYVGAGTSARIAVQDGVELIPTFGWSTKRLKFIIAGGKSSLTKSIEGAEDLRHTSVKNVVGNTIKPNDVVIGLAASGSTKFTTEIIKYANKIGALTIGISNNLNSKLEKISKISIILNTGAEIVAGSTRLKAGTAQKICLNLISTIVMARLGKVKRGMMNNLIPTNRKLIDRKKIINSLLSIDERGT